MMVIDPGKMNEEMEIQLESETQDSHGGKEKTWAFFARIMGDFQPARQSLINADDKSQTYEEYEIRTPWVSGVVANTMRIYRNLDQQAYLIIAAINVDNRNLFLRLRCRRFV